jgi:hypothetical protein
MRTLRSAFTLVVVLAVSASLVYATPQPASGTFQVTGFTPTAPPQQRGNTCFIEAAVTFTFEGTLVGSFAANITIRHAGECGEPGTESCRAVGTFAGTVAGEAGTFDFTFQGHIDAAGNARGELAIQRGTGGLSNLHGKLTLAGQAGVGGSYEGWVNFAP